MDGLQYARISYITAFPQKTDKRMSCYDRYSSRIRQCDPLVSCIIKHTAKAVCFIMKTNPNFNTNAPPFKVRGCKVILGGAFSE